MIQYLQGVPRPPLTLGEFVVNLIVACLCGLVQVAFYRATYRGPGYSPSFLSSLVLLAVITALVIMVIGDSLARAFGLVGAMSIIRFRTAVKEVSDVVHIFLALAIGMAAGVGLHAAAFLGTVLVGVFHYGLTRLPLGPGERDQYVLQFTHRGLPDGNGEVPAHVSRIERYCRQSRLVNVREVGDDGAVELAYYVQPRHRAGMTELVRDLRSLSGVEGVVVFSDDEQL